MSRLLELDDLLDSAPVTATLEQISDILQRRFGLTGPVRRLSSERDANFHIDSASGSYLLKITNSAEDPAMADFQTAALHHLAREAPSLPVPRIIPALDGADQPREILNGKTHIMRLMSFMPGAPAGASIAASDGVGSAIGEMLARIDIGLNGFDHPASAHDLLWNAADALRIRSALHFVKDRAKRRLAEVTLDEYEEHTALVLSKLRRQVIHNDFNPHNVLFGDGLPPNITGVIDFGDIIMAPLISEVSTALAYQNFERGEPFKVVSDIIRAYDEHVPLELRELDVVLDLVRARQVLVGVISEARVMKQPENGAYILRNNARAWIGLETLHGISRDRFRQLLTQACARRAA